MNIGERIKAQRDKKGWSQRELSRQSGVPQGTISRLESGAHQDISMSVARRLAR